MRREAGPGDVLVVCPNRDIMVSGVSKSPEVDNGILTIYGEDDNKIADFKEWEGWIWMNRCMLLEDLPDDEEGELPLEGHEDE